MRIVTRRTLREFWENSEYRDSEQQLKDWYKKIKKEYWETWIDAENSWAGTDTRSDKAVVNICGNKYRLLIRIYWKKYTIYIRGVLTHEEYAIICNRCDIFKEDEIWYSRK
jgi:mRNA interferase HigB